MKIINNCCLHAQQPVWSIFPGFLLGDGGMGGLEYDEKDKETG